MKPHLPVSLFRSLLTAVAAFPFFAYSAQSDVPAGYTSLTISEPGQIDKGTNYDQVAYLLRADTTTSTLTWDGAATFFTNKDKEVMFTGEVSSATCNIIMRNSGRLLAVGDIAFTDLDDITVDSNNFSTSADKHGAIHGGIFSAGTLTLSTETGTEGNLKGFEDDTAKISFTKNNNIVLTRNSLSYTIKEQNTILKGYAMGAVVGAAVTDISGNKDVRISTNTLTMEVTGKIGSISTGYGGAVFGKDVIISNNEDVIFENNRLKVISSDKAVAAGAAIGAIGNITITGNDSVVFRGNAIRENESYYLESLGIVSDNRGLLSVAAGSVGTVHFYDPINVDGNVSFNNDFNDKYGQLQTAGGEIIFSSEYAESDLTTARQQLGAENATPDDAGLERSRTSVAMGTTTLHNGSMKIEKGAAYSTGAYQAAAGSTLILNNGSLHSRTFMGMKANQGNGKTTFLSGSNLHIQGVGNSIEASAVTFEGNNTITFDISPKNATDSGLTINIEGTSAENKLSFGAGITIHLASQTSVTDDEYKLITLSPTAIREGWSTANITVTSSPNLGFTATYANLQWRDNVLYYCTTLPKLQKATWSNADGDFVWSLSAINWTENGQQYAFANGAQATFTDTGAGTVTIEGDITPASVLVNNTEAGYYEWKAAPQGGKLTGEMKLTKKGTGELKVSLANDYSGGSIVEGGTLTAGHAQAFGTGTITIDGGHLDTGTYAVTNDVILKNGQFSGTAYDGELSISDTTNASVGANTTAKSVVLKNATVTGGSFTDTNITAADSTINAILTGNTNLTVNGNTTLEGDHTTGGTFTVKKGVLTLNGTTTANWKLEGGYLSTENPIALNIGQTIEFNGGNLQGTLQTGLASKVTVSNESGVTNLNLNGGTYIATAPDITLQVGGTLDILGVTQVDVSSFTDGGTYTLISAGEIKGETSNLKATTDNRNTFVFENKNNNLELTVQENAADLYWKAGQTGEWGTENTQEWDTTADDKRFFNRDKVYFSEGGTVKLVSDVTPASVTVEGNQEVTLNGSGSISGATTTLTKRDDGVLNLNATNTYEGGTSIEGGTVNAGGVDSFGKGKILLTGGLLNMGDYAVTNDVEATGGEFVGTAYNGTVTVNGDLSVGEDTTAKEIVLKSGSISNGKLINTTIIADGNASIKSKLMGTTSIQVDKGEVILNCENESDGTVTVNDGILSYTGAKALGVGDIYLNGGQMHMLDNTELILTGTQKLHLRGGQLQGNTRTGNATSIVVSKDSTITGNLDLNGGTIYFKGKEADTPAAGRMVISSNGCTLTVTGALTLRADTLINLEKGQYADGDILLEADSLTGDFSQLVLEYDDGNPNTEFALEYRETEDNKVQIILDLDKVYEHENDNWVIANADLRDLLVQSNWGMFASSHAFTDALQGQRSASGTVGSHGVMAWASALYSHMSVNDDGAMNGGDSDTMGAAVGIETMVGTRSCIGLAVGVTSTDISVGNISDEMEQDATHFGIYGATVLSRLSEVSGLTLSWSAAYGSVESSPSRAASSIEWQQESFQLNGRVDWSRSVSGTTAVNVFAGLEYFMTTSDEVDGVDSGEIRNLRAELGAGITRRYSASVLYAEARLLGDIVRDNPTPGIDGRSEEGANPGTVGAGFRVGAAYDINQFWSIGANGSVEIMGDAVSAGANIGASLKF